MGAAASSADQISSDLPQPQPRPEPVRLEINSKVLDVARFVALGDFGQVRRLATRQLVSATDEVRRTVLMLVADTPETPVQAEKCILYLFELRVDPKAKDEAGDTAAHLAARRDHVRVLALLPFDAKWLQNERGATPLMEAAWTGGWRCAKHLLHLLRQKELNECEKHGNSVRKRLLGLKDLSGRTALDMARLSDHSELASYIKRYEGKKYFDEPLDMPQRIRTDQDEDLPSDEEPETLTKVPLLLPQVPAVGEPPMRLESDFYPVTNPQGFCLIINICNYAAKSNVAVTHEERQGSEKDVERVKQVFEKLQFTVQVRQDLAAEQIDDFLNDIKRSKDLAQHGSFVCFIMAHGSHDCIYCSDGVPYEIRKLTDRFQANVCPRLAKKPKIFFIQACRSNRIGSRNSRVRTDEAPAPVRDQALTPAEGDFLVCFASTPGSVAFRSIETGSYFVQTVCEFIERDFKTCELARIMTRVSGHMQKNPICIEGRFYPLVPQKVEQLSREVCIDPERAGILRNAECRDSD